MSRADYFSEIMELVTKNSNDYISLEVFDNNKNMYLSRLFAVNDFVKMKEVGINFLIKICNHGLSSREEPWWHHAWRIREHLQVEHDYVFRPLVEIAEDEKEKLWNAFVWFIETMYATPRYRWRQQTLWRDMRKDSNFSKQFFSGQPELYVEFLLHHISALVGNKLRNVRGD